MKGLRHLTASAAFFAVLLGVATAGNATTQYCDAPDMMVVLDQSGSMNDSINGITKYNMAKSAVDSVLVDYEAKVRFGLMFFPSSGSCGTGAVEVWPDFNMRSTIKTKMDATSPNNNKWTPLVSIMDSALEKMTNVNYPAPRRRHVLLLTDGQEYCHAKKDDKEFIRDLLKTKALAMAAAGIKVYVVGFGDKVDAKALNQIAYFSGSVTDCNPNSNDPNANNNCYFNVTDQSGLNLAFQLIAAQISEEICDGKDNNCDGQVDEGFDIGGSCTVGVGECQRTGVKVCATDGTAKCTVEPGTPTTETCNGKDDNCDGIVDNVEGKGDVCYNGVGACRVQGKKICGQNGELICDAVPNQPTEETCDGIDNNCNGVVDDVPGLGDECTKGVGECKRTGVKVCGQNGLECNAAPGTPGTETCNGKDDNCDGIVDNVDGLGGACSVGVGACQRTGVWICGATGLVCSATPGTPGVETCNGQDDNCNGIIDDVPGLNDNCSAGVGECKRDGKKVCDLNSQSLVCNATPGSPGVEICDGKDNNCNGVVDDVPGLNDNCSAGVGECKRDGKKVCDLNTQSLVCNAVPGRPGTEICDGKDNNCSGVVDDVPGLNDNCSAGVGECKRDGKKVCNLSTQSLVCNAVPGTPGVEICDGKDNNCSGVVDDVPGLNDNCSAGVGECKRDGKKVCNLTTQSLVCNAVPGTPGVEICDGKDNNCSGVVDDVPGLNDNCSAGVGECKRDGKKVCDLNSQSLVCNAVPGTPGAEICDGKDNNCSGVVDDVPGLNDACSNGVGECKRDGKKVCNLTTQSLVCDAVPGTPGVEICDGKDNNCSGVVDDVPGLNDACSNGVGECKRDGKKVCDLNSQSLVCNATPGTPGAEICDGKDNNCNGVVDDVPGLNDACSAGIGECKRNGKKVCDLKTQSLVCDAVPGTPGVEICDGKDNNCDGIVDNAPGVGDSCSVGVGACESKGTKICGTDGKLTCNAQPKPPTKEICDGIDNDCNGKVDDVAGVGDSCTVGTGQCQSTGKWLCTPTGLKCDTVPKSSEKEVCDGIDNDCNGYVDDVPGIGAKCSVGVGECKRDGKMVCGTEGKLVCDAVPGQPTKEICDGKDNDCNGFVDEGLEYSICGVGACQVRVRTCVDGKPKPCVPLEPTEEVCDGIDNNCDGQVDEGLTRTCEDACVKGPLSTEEGDDCLTLCNGVQTCSDGKWGKCEPKPEPELCDNKDNNCDGIVDNETTDCPNGTCFCGGCAEPCTNGECAKGVCIDGICATDQCPEGNVCDFETGTCKDPKKPTDPGDQGTDPKDPNDPGDQGTDPKDPNDPGDQGDKDAGNEFGSADTSGLGNSSTANGKQTDDSYRGGSCQQSEGPQSGSAAWLFLLGMLGFVLRRRFTHQ